MTLGQAGAFTPLLGQRRRPQLSPGRQQWCPDLHQLLPEADHQVHLALPPSGLRGPPRLHSQQMRQEGVRVRRISVVRLRGQRPQQE